MSGNETTAKKWPRHVAAQYGERGPDSGSAGMLQRFLRREGYSSTSFQRAAPESHVFDFIVPDHLLDQAREMVANYDRLRERYGV